MLSEFEKACQEPLLEACEKALQADDIKLYRARKKALLQAKKRSVPNFHTYTDRDLEEDSKDKHTLKEPQHKKRKPLTVNLFSPKKRSRRSRSATLDTATESGDSLIHHSGDCARAVDAGKQHDQLSLVRDLNKTRDVTLPLYLSTFHPEETLDPKKVNLDYATPPPNIPVPEVTAEPGINGPKGSKHLPSAGDGSLVSLMCNGKYPDIAARAGKEPLASGDEEELIELMRKIMKEMGKGMRKLRKEIRKLRKEMIIELMRQIMKEMEKGMRKDMRKEMRKRGRK